jgi:signal transduction histidine kinase
MESRSVAPTLGRRFVLMVLVGAVLPLGLIGLWSTRSAARSGRILLESQLESNLNQANADLDQRWKQLRSQLLTIAENEPVRRVLVDSGGYSVKPPTFAERAFEQMTVFSRVEVLDRAGHRRFVIGDNDQQNPAALDHQNRVDARGVVVKLPITDLLSGDTIGSVVATVRGAAVLPSASLPAATSGPLVAVFGRDGGSVVPGGADERLFGDETIQWGGHEWLTVRRSLAEPRVDLAVAGALDPYVNPFQRSSTRGALALLVGALLIVFVMTLLTRRLTRQLEREFAQREALAAVGEFASELSHEVRNPLTAIRLDLQRVEEEAEHPAVVRTVVPRVLRQIERLDRAVTGALRVSRGGSIEPHRVDVKEVLEQARRTAEPEFTQRGAKVSVHSPEATLPVDGDAGALEQLFLNLMINAAQALKTNGEARVEAARHNGSIEVTIVDTGVGMTPAQLEDVKKPFRSSRRDGTGLGLKIARRIVASHHGDIEMTSAPGMGTTVRVRIPAGGGTSRESSF